MHQILAVWARYGYGFYCSRVVILSSEERCISYIISWSRFLISLTDWYSFCIEKYCMFLPCERNQNGAIKHQRSKLFTTWYMVWANNQYRDDNELWGVQKQYIREMRRRTRSSRILQLKHAHSSWLSLEERRERERREERVQTYWPNVHLFCTSWTTILSLTKWGQPKLSTAKDNSSRVVGDISNRH